MKQKLNDARDDLFAEYKPGNASKYILPFDRLKATDKVLLVERVSGRERKENLKDQDRNLKGAARKVGAKVVGRFPIQCSGFDPSWLRDAAKKASKLSRFRPLAPGNCSSMPL